MTRCLIAAVAVLLGLAIAAPARAAPAAAAEKVTKKDMKFLHEAARGGEVEVALGKVAVDKAATDDVKRFGQLMVDDHTRIGTELLSLAQAKNVDLSDAIRDAGRTVSKKTDKLSRRSGVEFDREYMKQMVKDHQKDVKAYHEASLKADDPDIRAFAVQTLPVLQAHLDRAKEIEGRLSK